MPIGTIKVITQTLTTILWPRKICNDSSLITFYVDYIFIYFSFTYNIKKPEHIYIKLQNYLKFKHFYVQKYQNL